jgi:hypothetical protein
MVAAHRRDGEQWLDESVTGSSELETVGRRRSQPT